MRITFLGTGTSHGIPVIGCRCPVCRSRDPKNRRARAGVHVESRGMHLLIDAPPELRVQAVRFGVTHADAMLLTHDHADHTAGLDDVRIFSERRGRPFPVYASAATLAGVKRRFDYVFRKTQTGGGKPRLSLREVSRPFRIGPARVTPLPVWHGNLPVLGYRVGGFAYITDVSRIPEDTRRRLADLDLLVLDALRREPHDTHFHLEAAVAEAAAIGARRTYFTHMCHFLDHRRVQQDLPRGVRLAYDGLVLRSGDRTARGTAVRSAGKESS